MEQDGVWLIGDGRAQHPVTGGWRYQPGDDGDTSQLGWQLMSLHSAQLAGLPIPTATRAGMIRFLNSVTTGPQRGLASYRPRTSPSRTMTAEALVCRMFLGLKQDEAAIREAIAYLLQETPQGGPFNEYDAIRRSTVREISGVSFQLARR